MADEGAGLIVKINTTPWPGGCTEIEYFICNAMESSRDGIAESAFGTAENVVNAMGRLVALMAAKGHLTAPEVAYIAKDSFDDGATFDID